MNAVYLAFGVDIYKVLNVNRLPELHVQKYNVLTL